MAVRAAPWGRRPLTPGMGLGASVIAVLLILIAIVVAPVTVAVCAKLSWLASVVFNLGTLFASRQVARKLPAGDPARRFWRAISVAGVMMSAGYAVQILSAEPVATSSVVPATALLTGFAVALVVVVMFTYPLRIRSGRERICVWLDTATVMVGAGAFGWYCAGPAGVDVRSALLNLLAGWIIQLVAIFAVVKLLVSGRPPFSTWAGVLGAAGAGVGGLANVLASGLIADGRASWFLAMSALGDACVMIAAQVQRLQVAGDPDALQRPRRRPYSVLPYVGLAGTFILLSVALVGHGLEGRTWAVFIGAVISVGLVVARQLASFTDNARLLRQLDVNVQELHRTEAVLRQALRERDELAERLHAMAFQDSLTGLANRALFHDRLESALTRGRRHGTPLAVMLLDLDDFKPVNDTLGHAAGDAVLRQVAVRLLGCVRETDTVARIGGDEFAILFDNPMPGSVEAIAERVVNLVREPLSLPGVQVQVGVSVGLAYDVSGEHQADQLLSKADAAMYLVKKGGKMGYLAALPTTR